VAADHFEERNALEITRVRGAIPYPAVPRLMTQPARRFRHPGPMPGGNVVRDANGQALAYIYSRDNEDEALRRRC